MALCIDHCPHEFPKTVPATPPPLLFSSKLGKNQVYISSVAGNEGTDRQTDKKRKLTEDLLKLGKNVYRESNGF